MILTKNKKAVLEDPADAVMSVLGVIILLVSITALLFASADGAIRESTQHIGDFKQKQAAINNLRVLFNEEGQLPDVESSIAQSRLLNGRVITTCYDYNTQADCESNPLVDDHCRWMEEVGCEYGIPFDGVPNE